MKGSKTGKKNMLMILIVAGVVLIVAILAIVNSLMPTQEVAPSVEVVAVENSDVSEQLDTTGTVKSMQVKTFFSPVNAKVDKLNFEAGDVVRAGEQLVDFDLADLEKENQKAELSVLSSQYDYQDTVNQSKKQDSKVADAKRQVGSLQSQVNDWQNYVNALQAQINQETSAAQSQAQEEANQAAAETAELAQELTEQYNAAVEAYNENRTKLYNRYIEKLNDYNAKNTEATFAQQEWLADASNDKKKEAAEKAAAARDKAQLKLTAAQEAYEQSEADKPDRSDYTVSSSGYDASSIATADTAWLQQELEQASTELAKLQGELATQEAIADSDGGTLTKEMNEKLLISTNLQELEAKSLEELIADGEKGIQAEFTGVISDSKIVSGSSVSQGLEMFTLQSIEDVSVEVSVSKYDYEKVKEGQKAVITMASKKYEGTVTKVDRIAIPNEKGTPLIGVVVHIDNPDEDIFIGVEAKVAIQAAEANNVPVVPVEVVNIGNDGSFCYVIEDGKIAKRIVETGVSDDASIEITNGLKAGDQVITDIGILSEGDAVTGVEGLSGAADGLEAANE